MNNILLSLGLLLTTQAAFAAPEVAPPEAGRYGYSGEFRAELKLRYSVVYAFTPAGKAELEQRRKDHEECWNKGRETWLCKAFVKVEGDDLDLVRTRVASQIGSAQLELGALRGEPTLLSKGEDVAEYLVPQAAAYDGKSYDDYRWMVSRGLWSLRLGQEYTEAQLNLIDGGLWMPLQVSHTLSRVSYEVFVVSAAFRRM